MPQNITSNSNNGKKETLRDWKVALLCSGIYFFSSGIQRTGMVFFAECIKRYNINREKASIPFTVSYFVVFFSGPFIGYLGNHFQLRSLVIFGSVFSSIGILCNFWAEDIIIVTLFWGIIYGLGMSFPYNLLLELLNRHFNKHYFMACGLYTSGASFGSIILPYLSKFLLDIYGLSGTFLIFGGLTLNTIPLAMSLPVYHKTKNSVENSSCLDIHIHKHSHEKEQVDEVTHTSQNTNTNSKSSKTFRSCISFKGKSNIKNGNQDMDGKFKNQKSRWSSFQLFLNPTFLTICVIQSCYLSVIATMNLIILDYCLEKNLTLDHCVYVVMVVPVADIVGRIGLNWITDCGFIEAGNFLIFSFVSLGISCLMFVWSESFAMCVVSSVVYGIFYGTLGAYSPKLVKDFIDPKERTMAVASKNLFLPPFLVALPSILGLFKDTVKSYDGLMYILFAMSCLSAGLTFIIHHLHWRTVPLEH